MRGIGSRPQPQKVYQPGSNSVSLKAHLRRGYNVRSLDKPSIPAFKPGQTRSVRFPADKNPFIPNPAFPETPTPLSMRPTLTTVFDRPTEQQQPVNEIWSQNRFVGEKRPVNSY